MEKLPKTKKPIFLKIAPDIANPEALARIALKHELGIIIANTVTAPNTKPLQAVFQESLFLSAPQNFCETFYRLTNGQLTLIGVGGIFSGRDAYEKIRCGASLLQLYTALVYEGPAVIHRIKQELAELLRKDGFASVSEAVGVDAK